MKDLDFDELDRAVNSLLGGNTAPLDKKDDTAAPIVAETADPVVETVVPDAVAAAPISQPLAARRSTGRFMDVVHPSSDMRSATIPARPISRVGVNIAPVLSSGPVVVSDQSWSAPVPSTPVASEAPQQQPAPSEWPDPIDFNGYTAETSEAKPESAGPDPTINESVIDEDKDINQIADAINQTLSQEIDSQGPLESPFLTDAKVEKRPLGAFSAETVTPPVDLTPVYTPADSIEPDVQESIEPTPDHSDVSEDHPTQIETVLPAELQDDLLQIESDTDTTNQSASEVAVNTKQPQPAVQAEIPVGPTSITQQYTEQPSTGDQPSGAIFDTEAYKKPLNHPAKKKSGWLFVLWIFLLLAVGAGAGALVFFFVLPML